MSRIALATLLAALVSVPLLAQSTSEDLERTVQGTIDLQRQTQKQQDEWAAEKSELVLRYRAAKVNVEYLSDRRARETDKAAAVREQVEEMERRLRESVRLQESIQDTLDAVFLRLEDWVERDLPFLEEERQARLASLKADLARPNVSPAEKLRHLLEALQVEAGYGGTVEINQRRIRLGEEDLFVDVLHLGRVSLFWRTPDGERVGEFDRARGAWVEMPGKYNRPIRAAMDMAARIRPVELVALPLGRIQP